MKKITRGASAALVGFGMMAAVPAFAADAIVNEEPPAPSVPMENPPLNTWSGPYAGVQLAYSFNGRVRDRTTDNSIDTDGAAAGVFAGYNMQNSNFVYGVEGDVGYNWADGRNAGLSTDSGVEGSLRARLGYSVTPDVLVYATAGGAAKRAEISDFAGSDTKGKLGYTVGAGTDVKLTENIFGRVEYRYTDLGRDTFNTGSGPREVDDRSHRVSFGLGMKF